MWNSSRGVAVKSTGHVDGYGGAISQAGLDAAGRALTSGENKVISAYCLLPRDLDRPVAA